MGELQKLDMSRVTDPIAAIEKVLKDNGLKPEAAGPFRGGNEYRRPQKSTPTKNQTP